VIAAVALIDPKCGAHGVPGGSGVRSQTNAEASTTRSAHRRRSNSAIGSKTGDIVLLVLPLRYLALLPASTGKNAKGPETQRFRAFCLVDLAGRLANHSHPLQRLSSAPRQRREAVEVRHERQFLLSPEQNKRLVRDYLAGENMDVLASRYGVHEQTVSRHVRKAGHQTRGLSKRLAYVDFSSAPALYKSGLSTSEIAARLDVSRETVRRRLHLAGVVLRPPGGRRSR
jgi:transposase